MNTSEFSGETALYTCDVMTWYTSLQPGHRVSVSTTKLPRRGTITIARMCNNTVLFDKPQQPKAALAYSRCKNACRLPLFLPANVSSQDRAHPAFPSPFSPEQPTGPASRNFLCKLQGIRSKHRRCGGYSRVEGNRNLLADIHAVMPLTVCPPRTKSITLVSRSKLIKHAGNIMVRGEAAGGILVARSWAGVFHHIIGVCTPAEGNPERKKCEAL